MIDPRAFAASETLRNCAVVTVRTLRPDDRERMASAIRGLDRESIYTRLFAYRELTDSALDRVMRFDPDGEIALVVTTGAGSAETIVGGGRYIVGGGPAGARSAEVAFVVEEDWHGLGIASRVLRHLAAIARDRGIASFEADVLAGNRAMLAVFERSRLPVRTRPEGGTVHVTLDLGAAAP